MTVSMNTIPSDLRVPLFYAEMDNSAANTAQTSAPSLLIGHANTGASIATNQLIIMPSKDYAIQQCGAGSQLARMVEAYRATDPFGELWVIAVPDTGTVATFKMAVTGAATESGVVSLYVGPRLIKTVVTAGDTVSDVATAIAAAITADGHTPFTATAAAGVVTLTARHKGTGQTTFLSVSTIAVSVVVKNCLLACKSPLTSIRRGQEHRR